MLSPNGRHSKFSFCLFLRKGVSHLTSRDIMVCKFGNGWETGSEKPVAVQKIGEIATSNM